jgi:hypothetical protein
MLDSFQEHAWQADKSRIIFRIARLYISRDFGGYAAGSTAKDHCELDR